VDIHVGRSTVNISRLCMREMGHPTVEEYHGTNVIVEDNYVTSDNDVDDLDEIFRNVHSEFSSKGKDQKFSEMMKDYETPVFLGCNKEYNKFHVELTL
jgi:hypothetical protein